MSYYKKHVFFCLNDRGPDRECCFNTGAKALYEYAKKRIKSLHLSGKHQMRINVAGCLGRCSEGPVMVIYPDNVWYTFHSEQDIDLILEQHCLQGKIVVHLRLRDT